MTGFLESLLLVTILDVASAGATGFVSRSAASEVAVISPTLRPNSDFGKDFPGDKRPKVDVLHFHHPYPAVQDSNDFDADFVKDENSDNGSYMAQMEYDRLRHKLAKEKADVKAAMEKKKKAEEELHHAMERQKRAEEEQQRIKEEQRIKEQQEKDEQEKKKTGVVSGSPGESEGNDKEHAEHKVVVPEKTPGGVTSPGRVKVASGETEEAMNALEECKRQLAQARDKLKQLMAELEDAKKRQQETQTVLDAALERQKAAVARKAALDKASDKEKQEYLEAKEAFDKQQQLVLTMEVEIKAAAAKVKNIRDAEDKDGGVYQTERSGGASVSLAPLVTLVLLFGSSLLL